MLAYLPFSEPEYSLQKNYTYQFRKETEKHGVEYFVRSSEFDHKYPMGSPGRENIEVSVIRDYKNMLGRYCHIELQRRQWNRNYPTPHCDRLQEFGVAWKLVNFFYFIRDTFFMFDLASCYFCCPVLHCIFNKKGLCRVQY